MNDDDWQPDGKARWKYLDFSRNRWRPDWATITCVGPGIWHLFINTQHIATFNSWEEARDATPMMLKLHGYESES